MKHVTSKAYACTAFAAAVSAALVAGSAALAQYNGYYHSTPYGGSGYYNTPSGTVHQNTIRVSPNTRFDTFSGGGRSVNCTTQRIGNQTFQNCH